MYHSSSIKASSSLPCTYMKKSSSFLKKIVSNRSSNNTIAPAPAEAVVIEPKAAAKYVPITIPATLTEAQKEAALPFLTQEPPIKTKKFSTSAKAKSLGRFIKKLANKSSTKHCLTKEENKPKTQYKLACIPIMKKKKTFKAEATEMYYESQVNSTTTNTSITTNTTATEECTSPAVVNTTAIDIAQSIWDQDTTVCNKNLGQEVEWIGNGSSSSNAVLQSYMAHFDFKALKLEQAFRNLCAKLHLKGETQQIDRILEQFSLRYFENNPHCIFGTTDIVHAIVYSFLLLNTDLHVAQGDYKKMTQSEFVKNTVNAISAQLGNSPEWFSLPLQRTLSDSFLHSTPSYSQATNAVFMPHSWNFGSKAWQIDIKDLLKQMYTNIRTNQIANPSTPPASLRKSVIPNNWKISTSSSTTAEKISSIAGPVQSSVMQYQAVASYLQNTELPTCYISNAPYYKEGMVFRKHLMESRHQKAKHRDWKECFMVIEGNQLCMYKLETTSCNKRSMNSTYTFSSSDSAVPSSEISWPNGNSTVLGGGDWMSSALLLGIIDLKHTLAHVLPSGYNHQRQHAFTLEQANGAVHIFQAGSAIQVQEFVDCINYNAARYSKEPLFGGISSMEYGWGHCLDNNKDVMIYEWQTPVCPTISSQLEESAQLVVLYKHVKELLYQMDMHRDIKDKMETHFSTYKFGVRAITNWENKSRYLLHEIIKYQNYCNSIEQSLSLQAALDS